MRLSCVLVLLLLLTGCAGRWAYIEPCKIDLMPPAPPSMMTPCDGYSNGESGGPSEEYLLSTLRKPVHRAYLAVDETGQMRAFRRP